MDELLISVSLYSLHKGVYLQLLMLPQFLFFFFHFCVDGLLMLLDFADFEFIRLLPQRVRFDVLFHEEVAPLLNSHLAAFLGKSEGVIPREYLLSQFDTLDVMFLS